MRGDRAFHDAESLELQLEQKSLRVTGARHQLNQQLFLTAVEREDVGKRDIADRRGAAPRWAELAVISQPELCDEAGIAQYRHVGVFPRLTVIELDAGRHLSSP